MSKLLTYEEYTSLGASLDFPQSPFIDGKYHTGSGKMMNTINDLYDKYKENSQIKEILNILKENNKYSFLFNNFTDLFTLLFSFEYFYYFHTCIAELEQSQSISDIIYEKFIKVLKNNNNI